MRQEAMDACLAHGLLRLSPTSCEQTSLRLTRVGEA